MKKSSWENFFDWLRQLPFGTFVFISLGTCILGSVIFLHTISDVKATALIGAGVICYIFAYLSKFKKFKGLGIEGEMWGETQQEAQDLVNKLKPLLVYISELSVMLACKVGRWGSAFSNRELYQLKLILDKHLDSNTLPDETINQIYEPFYRLVTIHMVNEIKKPFIEMIKLKEAKVSNNLDSYPTPIQQDDQEYKVLGNLKSSLSSELMTLREFSHYELHERGNCVLEFNNMIHKLKNLSSNEKESLMNEIQDNLEDLKYFIDTKKIRRLEYWLKLE